MEGISFFQFNPHFFVIALTLAGYYDQTFSVAISPDGKRIANVGNDRRVKVWDLESQKVTVNLIDNSSIFMSVAYSPDGKWYAGIGYKDKTLKIWDMTTQKILFTHIGFLGGVSFSPDGKWLASGSDDKTIVIWDLESRKILFTMAASSNYVYLLAFSPDGRQLAAVTNDNINIWDLESQKIIYTLSSSRTLSIAFSPDGKQIVSSGRDEDTIKIWNLESQNESLDLKEPCGELSVAIKDANWLISPGNSKDFYLVRGFTIYQFPFNSPEPVEIYKNNQDYLIRHRKNPLLDQPLQLILENHNDNEESPSIKSELFFNGDPDPMAGKPLFITVKITNTGNTSLYQVKATLVCKEKRILDNLDFMLGEIEPGATSYCVKTIDLPPDWMIRDHKITCILQEANGHKLEPIVTSLTIKRNL